MGFMKADTLGSSLVLPFLLGIEKPPKRAFDVAGKGVSILGYIENTEAEGCGSPGTWGFILFLPNFSLWCSLYKI